MDLGPVELLVVGFPGNRFTGDIVPALVELVEEGTIRVVDLLFVSKDADGTVLGFELTNVDDDVRSAFDPLLGGQEQLLSDEDVEDVGLALDPGSSAAILLFEHTWAIGFRSALAGSGAELIDSFLIPREVLEEARQGD